MYKDIIKIFKSFNYKHTLSTLFFDYLEMFACALSNRVLGHPDWLKREERFLELKDTYLSEYSAFIELTALITEELITTSEDVLGKLAHELEILNKWKGQYFTPYHISLFMAKIAMSNIEDVPYNKVFKIGEPACGAGGMILATAEVLSEKCDITKHMFVVGQDIDIRCVHMSYIQCAIKRIPAVIILGNTLAFECREQWYTPVVFEKINIFKDYVRYKQHGYFEE